MLASPGKADFVGWFYRGPGEFGAENRGAGCELCTAERPPQVAARDELRQERYIARTGVRHEVTRRKHRSGGIATGGRRRCERGARGTVELSKRTVNEGGQLGAH